MSSSNRVVLLLYVYGSFCYGQIGGGSIVGVAHDPTGAAVASAKIFAHNHDTNENHQVATNGEGYYEFPLLNAGRYHLEVEAAGFDRLRGEVFELAAGTRPRIDFSLRVGSV